VLIQFALGAREETMDVLKAPCAGKNRPWLILALVGADSLALAKLHNTNAPDHSVVTKRAPGGKQSSIRVCTRRSFALREQHAKQREAMVTSVGAALVKSVGAAFKQRLQVHSAAGPWSVGPPISMAAGDQPGTSGVRRHRNAYARG